MRSVTLDEFITIMQGELEEYRYAYNEALAAGLKSFSAEQTVLDFFGDLAIFMSTYNIVEEGLSD